VALVPGHEQGFVFVHYRLMETPDQGGVLAFYEQPVMTLEGLPEEEPLPEAFQPLIVGLSEASWQYRGDDASTGGAWQETWETAEKLRLPAAVRLQMRSGEAPPLSVVIRVVNPEGV